MHASWMQSIASLLADESALRLPSFERISLPASSRLLLEADTLQHACPAVVSRCALVTVESVVEPEQLVEAWVDERVLFGMQPEAVLRFREILAPLFRVALQALSDREERERTTLETSADGLGGVPQQARAQ